MLFIYLYRDDLCSDLYFRPAGTKLFQCFVVAES